MKKDFTRKILILVSFLLALNVNAQDVEFTSMSSTTLTDYYKEYAGTGVTLSTDQSAAQNGSEYYVQLGSSPSSADQYYVDVTTSIGQISKVEFLISGNGDDKTCGPALLGWESTYASNEADYAVDSIVRVVASKTIADAQWFSYDLSAENLTQIRLLRKVKGISLDGGSTNADFGNGQTIYIFGIRVWLKGVGPQAPNLTSLSIDGSTGVIDEDTIRVNLDYTSYTVGVSTFAATDLTIACDSTAFGEHVMDIDSVSNLTNITVGDTVKVVITNDIDLSLTNVYTLITTADVPVPTITDPANKSQAVKDGSTIADIVFTVENQTAVVATDLPTGLTGNLVGDVFTISGTVSTGSTYPDVYNYTVTVTGLVGANPATVVQTGTITVKDPSAKSVLYLTTEDAIDKAANLFLIQLNAKYDVTTQTPLAVAPAASAYDSYDLIVLHESIGSAEAEPGKEIGELLTVDKPILNMKSYFYKSTCWNLGAPENGVGESALEIEAGAESHPIFVGLTDPVTMFTTGGSKAIQYSTLSSTTGGNILATISGEGKACIHEMSATDRGIVAGTSKYLMVALFNELSNDLTADALTLLDNACVYLLGTTTTAVQSKRANIISMTIGGETVAVGDVDATVELPNGTAITALAVTADVSRGASLTVPVSLAAVDFTSAVTFTVTAEDGTTKDYSISVTIATDIAEAISVSKIYTNNATVIVEGEIGANVAVVNLVGNLIYKGVITSLTETLPLSLEKGVYIVIVDGFSTKIIVE